MRQKQLWGIDQSALEAALQDRQQQHRIALDQLRSRLGAAEGRLEELRARKAKLSGELSQLEGEVQLLLQEMERMGQESERPRLSLMERHRRLEEDLREGLALLEQERDHWLELERQVAEGVMAAAQPYLDLISLLPDTPANDEDEEQPEAEGRAPDG